jgi:hypothetical protein
MTTSQVQPRVEADPHRDGLEGHLHPNDPAAALRFDARLSRELGGHFNEGGRMETSASIGRNSRQPPRPCVAVGAAAPAASRRA